MAQQKKMVEAITSRDVDFAKWYTDIVKKAELADYSGVKGCMVIRPYGYAIWENMQKDMDSRFKKTGHENVYMPMFIPESLLQKEKDHVEGFAPECAWVTVGGSEKLIINLKNSNGKAFQYQSIVVKIASKTYNLVTDSKGQASVDVDLNPGKYNASVVFPETEKYHSSSANASVEILSTVEGIDVVKLYGSGTQYFAIFTDSNGKALGNTNVTFKISGNSYKVATLPNGIAKINVNFKPGEYVISCVNPATKEKLSNKITIIYPIMGKDSSNYVGSKTKYKVRIYKLNLNPVGKGKTVKFKINGKTYKVKTNKNGYAKLAIKLKAKKYTVTVKYSKYKITNKITVKKLLSAKNISVKKSKKVKFKAKLVNSKGKVQKNKKITFKIDGKKYTAKTNKKGIATLTLKNLKVGKHKIKSSYGKTTITNKITIKK